MYSGKGGVAIADKVFSCSFEQMLYTIADIAFAADSGTGIRIANHQMSAITVSAQTGAKCTYSRISSDDTASQSLIIVAINDLYSSVTGRCCDKFYLLIPWYFIIVHIGNLQNI